MRRGLALAFMFALVCGSVWAAGAKAPEEVARELVDLLGKGQFEQAVAAFDQTMRAALPAAALKAAWSQIEEQVGAFQRQGPPHTERLGGYVIVYVPCTFERAALDAKVVLAGDGRIAGLFFVPSVPRGDWAPPDYVRPDSFEEREVTVGEAPWALPGTLAMPRGDGPFPGLVLVHGSGPQDRDETIGPNEPFRDLAQGLASRGIAVLRYDKRTLVHGQQMVADPHLTVQEETIEDALAAVRLLRGTERVDRQRVTVLGHSLGGMLVPRMAAQDEGIAGFIIAAGNTRPFDLLYVVQLRYIAGLDGTVTDAEQAQVDEAARLVAEIASLTEADADSTRRLLGAPPAYWLDLRGYDPAHGAAAMRGPVLVLQGGRDYQVTAEDLEGWRKAFGGREGARLVSYPHLNHLFMEGSGPGTPEEYDRPGHVAPQVIADIADWIAGH